MRCCQPSLLGQEINFPVNIRVLNSLYYVERVGEFMCGVHEKLIDSR